MKEIEKNESCLLLGKWTSLVGNILFDYANSVSIVSLFGNNPFVLGIYQGSESIVNIILNLLGGVFADGKNKKKILILTDLISSIICFVTSFLVQGKQVAAVLIIANLLLAVVFSFNSPVYSSILRSVVRKERIVKYNSTIHTGSGVIKIVIPLIAVFLVKTIGARGVLLVDAATFFASCVTEMLLKPFEEGSTLERKEGNVFKEIGEGIKYIYTQKNLLILILISAGVNLFLAGYNLLLPYTDIVYCDRCDAFYGKALAVQAVGGIISSWLNTKRKKNEVSVGEMIFFLGMTGVGLLCIPFVSHLQSVLINLLPYIVFGMFLTLYNTQFMSYVQMTAEAGYLGRVFSVIFSVAVLFMPVGSFLFSVVFNIQNVNMFAIVGGGIILLAVIGYLFVKRLGREEKKNGKLENQ